MRGFKMEATNNSTLSKYTKHYDREKFLMLNETMTLDEYMARCVENPKLLRNSYQYIYDMIMADGTSTFKRFRKTYTRYNFFTNSRTKIFGLEESLDAIINYLEGAAGGFGTQKRFLLLHGPVGSSKSTICRAIKEGLEKYSRTDAGAWYTFDWYDLPAEVFAEPVCRSALRENPIKLLPPEILKPFLADVNAKFVESFEANGVKTHQPYDLNSEGEMNPRCKLFMKKLLDIYKGDWNAVVTNHVRVVRLVHSESDRVGIGTFQPKDEKNQDSTELTGDVNFRNIGFYGSDSDPRAFNFDGEFEVGNRGMIEFIEALKLQNEFLYDLLEATQDHSVKPKKFSRIAVDELIIGHTNNPEYEKLRSNRYMEALRDRTVKVDIPYLLRVSDELKVLQQDYAPDKIKQHIMPHTLEVSAFFAVLTRLYDDPDHKLDLRDKAKLYDGKSLPNWTEDGVKELRDKYPSEGMQFGVSARYVQDCISSCIAREKTYVNAFHVLNELKSRLQNSSLVDAEYKDQYVKAHELAVKELQDILKNEVQKALVADENLIVRVCAKYIDNVVAFVNHEKVRNPITGQDQEPDERLMRSIEEKIEIPDQGSPDFRRSIAAFIGTLANRGQTFRWDSNPELKRALELKLFDDTKDTIKLSSLSSEASAVDPELQEKIDAIKTRLIKNFGYNEKSATDVLEYVSSIFASSDEE
jgi:serine protein kinase